MVLPNKSQAVFRAWCMLNSLEETCSTVLSVHGGISVFDTMQLSNLSAFAECIFFFFLAHAFSLLFCKASFLCPEAAFCVAHLPCPWHPLVWCLLIISHIPRHNLWREGNTLKLTSLALCMILCTFFQLICLDFFRSFLLSVALKSRLLLALFCSMSVLWGCCCCYAEVSLLVNKTWSSSKPDVSWADLFQLGGLLISSGERRPSSPGSSRVMWLHWLCCLW